MKNRIYFSNEQQDIKVDAKLRGLITRCVNGTLKYENLETPCEVSVTFCNDEYIRDLNAQYRGIDKKTDVLSFPTYERDDILALGAVVANECLPIGDIVISTERAIEQSKEYGHTLEREIAFLCVHSMLHLLGYDHEISESEEKTMFGKQEAVLEKLGITR